MIYKIIFKQIAFFSVLTTRISDVMLLPQSHSRMDTADGHRTSSFNHFPGWLEAAQAGRKD